MSCYTGGFPAKTIHWPNPGLVLTRRLRRRPPLTQHWVNASCQLVHVLQESQRWRRWIAPGAMWPTPTTSVHPTPSGRSTTAISSWTVRKRITLWTGPAWATAAAASTEYRTAAPALGRTPLLTCARTRPWRLQGLTEGPHPSTPVISGKASPTGRA